MTFQLVTDASVFRQLAPAWQGLLRHSAHPEPMLSPEWLHTWWDVYGRGRQLAVGVWRQGDQLIGLAPLCRGRWWYRPGIPFRRLEFLGSDVAENDGVCSNYLNLLARTGYEDQIAETFGNALCQGDFGPWDECVLSALDGAGAMPARLLASLRAHGYRAELTSTSSAPYFPLPASWDDFLGALGHKKRYAFNAALRNFDKWAPPQDVQLERAQTPEQVERGMRILASLHAQRWQAENEPGAFSSPRFDAFHQRYASLLLERGQLDLTWLCVRGEPVAAIYSIFANEKVYFYQCGRKMDVPSRVRLGIVMCIHTMQRAMAEGLREFDFLAGDYSYKSEFTELARPIVQLRVARFGWPELTRRTARGALHVARNVGRGARAAVAGVRQLFQSKKPLSS